MKKILLAVALVVAVVAGVLFFTPLVAQADELGTVCRRINNNNGTRAVNVCATFDTGGQWPSQYRGEASFAEVEGDALLVEVAYVKLWWRQEGSSAYCSGDPAPGGSCEGQGNNPGELVDFDCACQEGFGMSTAWMGRHGFERVHTEVRARVRFTAGGNWSAWKTVNSAELTFG